MHEGSVSPRDHKALANTPPFDLLTYDVLDVLASRMEPCRFAPGEHLVAQGETSGALYVIESGSVRVLVEDGSGERREVARTTDGVVIGEMSLLTREPHTADVVAHGEVHALRLMATEFDDIARDFPEVVVVLTEILAERLGNHQHDSLGGKQAGDYRIVRCVGRGGMAAVYEANHIETGDRVALKMMNHRLVYHAGARARFHREAKMLLDIEHPGVTRMVERFDAYRTSFLVMEFCDGPSLGEFIRSSGPFPEATVRAILGQLAGALEHLHRHQVVHRDLKPANVLLTTQGEAKLSDFGLAKPNFQQVNTNLTQEGTMIGTPRYMAPETFQGADAEPAADIYALGCLGLELLLGRPPFAAKNLTALIAEKGRWEMPAAASFEPAISAELHDFFARCMQHDPALRSVDLKACAAWAAPISGVS